MATQSDVEVKMWCPPGELTDSALNIVLHRDRKWLSRMQANGGMMHLLRTRPLQGFITAISLMNRLGRAARSMDFDVAHVNWLQNALPLWRQGKPMLVTVLGSDYGLLRVPGMVFLLRLVFKRNKSILAPNAEWMTARLQACFGDIAEIRSIPFGVDPAFLQIKRTLAQIPTWLVVTRLTKNKLGKLFEWAEHLFCGAERKLILLGPMQEQIALPGWIDWQGPTDPNALASVWFPQATGLITLSSHDEGRPQILLDAMAAGLPVIASTLPAHIDVIEHGTTGWIVDSILHFGEALQLLEEPVLNHKVGNAARKHIASSVGNWTDCATRYTQAYRDLLTS